MSIFALADLHLCFSKPEKSMEIFGPPWISYQTKIKTNWEKTVKPEDLVLIPGDIAWASKMEEALLDLKWIDDLPGQKLIIKGNHDYWWPSSSKLKAALPPSIHFLSNDAFNFGEISIAGSRMWDAPDFNFDNEVNSSKEFRAEKNGEKAKKIYQREIERLKMSLACLDPKAKLKIAMTHFPPISADLKDSQASVLFEKAGIDICVFGHLHNLKKEKKLFGEKKGVKYFLCSADFLDFQPFKIHSNSLST